MFLVKYIQFQMFIRALSKYITDNKDTIQLHTWSFDCAKIKYNDGTAPGTSEKLSLTSYKSGPAVSTNYAAPTWTCVAHVKRKEILFA